MSTVRDLAYGNPLGGTVVAIQLFAFLLDGRLSQEGIGYHGVQHRLDLDGKAATEGVARRYVAGVVAVAVAMIAPVRKLDGVGRR